MKKNEELSQRDREKLDDIRRKMACSPEFRNKVMIGVIKQFLMESPTDDDEQKANLLLSNNSYLTSDSKRSYRILCETILKDTTKFAPELVKKARSFANANKLELVIPAQAPKGKKVTA